MLNNISKHEIEEELSKRGKFVQINYLGELLKKTMPTDVKIFACKKLAEIYENKRLFSEAAKVHHSAAIISITFNNKIKYHLFETECYIKAGNFQDADDAMRKAMNQANSTEKNEIYITVKQIYLDQAMNYEQEKRRNHASKIYEKILEMRLTDLERKEVKQKLLELYDKLGKTKEYFALKREIQ